MNQLVLNASLRWSPAALPLLLGGCVLGQPEQALADLEAPLTVDVEALSGKLEVESRRPEGGSGKRERL